MLTSTYSIYVFNYWKANSLINRSFTYLIVKPIFVIAFSFIIFSYQRTKQPKVFNYVVTQIVENKPSDYNSYPQLHYYPCQIDISTKVRKLLGVNSMDVHTIKLESFPKIFISEIERDIITWHSTCNLECQLNEIKDEATRLCEELYDDECQYRIFSEPLRNDLENRINTLFTEENKCLKELEEIKKLISKITYYKLEYWPYPQHYQNMVIADYIREEALLDLSKPTLRYLCKKFGFNERLAIDTSIFTEKDFLSAEIFTNRLSGLLSNLMESVILNKDNVHENTTYAYGEKIKVYYFCDNQDKSSYLKALQHSDYKGKWFVIMPAKPSVLSYLLTGHRGV